MSQATRPDTTIPPTRRAVLAHVPAAAAVAALATGTAANGLAIAVATPLVADPNFAVIDRHCESVRVHEEAMADFRAQEEMPLPPPDMHSSEDRVAWVKAELDKPTPRSIAYDRWNDSVHAVVEATDGLLDTPPATLAGAAAALEYWAEFVHDTYGSEEYDFLDDCNATFVQGIARAIRTMEAQS
jgi:hypothetical protein